MSPPFIPSVHSELDSSNFDEQFTSEEPRESLMESNILATQKVEKFTYIREGILH